MRGGDERSGALFSYVDLEARVGRDHPLRMIRSVVNEALAALSGQFSALYARIGRPSIPPEKLLRAMLLQAFYSIRSERQLMERLEFDLLFRWFVGKGGLTMRRGITLTPSKNRDRRVCEEQHRRPVLERGSRAASGEAAAQFGALPDCQRHPDRSVDFS